MKITENFTREELQCKCGCGQMPFSMEAVGSLQSLRTQVGFPLIVNSGFRCPEYNARVSSTGLDGPHTIFSNNNITVNLKLFGTKAFEVVGVAKSFGFIGVGLMQRGDYNSRYVHLDRLPPGLAKHPRPWVWTY